MKELQEEIKKFMEIGVLEKNCRGKYETLIKNEKEEKEKAINAFQNFKTFIINRNYEEAYNALIENVHHNINHDYDNHIKTYFLLLQIILGDTYDFSVMEELHESSEEKNGTYVDEFILFQENVMTKNYYEAKKHLNKFKRIEKERKGHNNLSSKLFSNLINEAIAKLEKENPNILKMNQSFSPSAYWIYQQFLKCYEEENYEQALEYITLSCTENIQDIKNVANNSRLLKLLTQLIKMEKEQVGFEQKEIDYSNCNTPVEILNRAIDNEDFRIAFKNIGKVTYQNKSQVLELFKDMLHKMYDLDQKYQKKQTKKEENLPDLKETNALTYDELYNYVYNRQYKELTEILTSKAEISRVEYFTLKMLNIFLQVKDNREKQTDYSYQSTELDSLKRMYEAIKYGDIWEIKSTIEKNKTFVKDTKEIDIYEMIVEDIIKECEVKQTETENQRSRMKIVKKMAYIVQNKTCLNQEELNELYNLVQERIEIESEEILYIYWEILNTITIAMNSNIDASYFESLENKSEDIDTKLLYLLRNGDYLSALNILKTLDFNLHLKEIQFEDKLFLKRLLYILKNVTNKTIEVKKEYANSSVTEDNTSSMEELKTKIKKRNFYGAFKYALQANLEDKFLKDILAELSILYAENIGTEEEIYKQYLGSIKNNDQNQVRISRINYEDLLKNTSMGENPLYQNRLEEMKRALKK